MYAFEQMLDLCDQDWQTESHRRVALLLLIGNGRIDRRQQLIDFGAQINSLSREEVEALTIEGAVAMGVPMN